MDAKTLRLTSESIDNTLHFVLETISEGVVVTDADWTITYANPAVERLTSLSLDHVINKNFWQIFRDLRGTLLDNAQPGTAKSTIKFSAYLVQQRLWVEVSSFPREGGGLTICFKDITTFKREAVAERSAMEARTAANANAKFRAFFEQGSQFAWLTTLDGTVIETNRYSSQATGLEHRNIVGKKFWEWGIWNHLPPVMEVVKQAILAAAAGIRFKRELTYSLEPESERYIDLSITPVTDDHGHTIFIAVMGIDITERRRLDAAFADMRTRLESMLTAAEVATWTWDAGTNQIIADRNLVQLFSIPTEKADSATLAEYYASIHPDDIDRVKALSKKAIAEGSLFEARYRVRMSDGNYRTVIARGRAQYDSNGLAVAFPGVVVDITSQAQAESELELSNQRYSALIELMDEGFCLLEILYDQQHRPHDYRFIEVNQAFEKQTGLIDPVGKTARAMVPDLEINWIETYARVAQTGAPVRFQMHSQAMGRTFDVYASRQGGRESNRVSLIFSDITARKLAEEALRNHANHLMESNRRKSEFLATLAHELRNPLAPLKNGVQLLKLSNDQPETITRVRSMMERQLNQMVRLVDDLLDIARINSGKIELKTERLRLNDIVLSAVETSTPLIESCNHQFTVDIHNDAIQLNADAARLAQVLSNLLNNAAKYTPPGGEIRLSSWDDGLDLFVAVKDNGIGLSEDAIASVFEMFSQVGRSLTQSHGGLGIGLSLVRQIIELHGGQVSAQSAGPGMGSTFLIRLPLNQSLAADHPQETAQDEAEQGSQPLRILLVDDNTDAAESLAALLTLIGHETLVAHEGNEAIAKAREFLPQIAFLDLGLPGMDGCELAGHLQRIPELSGLHLIALTGWGGKEDREKTAAAGFAEHLTKPTGFDSIQDVLTRFQTRMRG